jgi:biotin operon repressor
MVMLKDNHLLASHDLKWLQRAINRFRSRHRRIRIEIEADTLPQVRDFLQLDGVDVILLDNMSVAEMRKAVRLGAGRIQFEASGGVTLKRVPAIAGNRGRLHFRWRTHALCAGHRLFARTASVSTLDVAAPRYASRYERPPAGTHLATELGTTLPTVRERVAELRHAGFEIEERPNLGYRLIGSPDRLIADDMRARLGKVGLIREILVFAETDSTE